MLLCPWEDPRYLIFSSNVPDILFYSHIPAVITALLLGGFIFLHNKTPATKNLLILLLLFSFYTAFDLVIWASNRADLVLFLWSFQVLLEPFIFLFGLYFTYFFFGYTTISWRTKIISIVSVLPFIVLIPTYYDLVGVRLATCDAIEGSVALYYSYAIEILLVFWIMALCVKAYRLARESSDRKKGVLFYDRLIIIIAGVFLGKYSWKLH